MNIKKEPIYVDCKEILTHNLGFDIDSFVFSKIYDGFRYNSTDKYNRHAPLCFFKLEKFQMFF